MDFVLAYVLFCYVWLLSCRSLFFSTEKQKGSGSRGTGGMAELGGVEDAETVVRITEKKLLIEGGKLHPANTQ